MTSAGASLQAMPGPSRFERAWHICVFCAFAFSEPLFEALTQQFVYLHDLNAGWVGIGYVLFLLMVLIPAGWVLLDQLAVSVSTQIGGRGCNLILTLLMGLVWLSFLRPFMRFQFLESECLVWLASLVLATAGAFLSIQLYQGSRWVRRWVSVASLGIVCFPGMFVYLYGCLSQVPERSAPVPVERPVPVVMVVFDELSGTTLMNVDLQVDAKNFPQFGRLAGMSTWYRQASTVHNRTDVAVPALLSGQFPTVKRPALESEYPGNLFRVIHDTGAFEMTVFEPVTRLCPGELKHHHHVHRSSVQKLWLLTQTLAAVYPRLIFPNDMPIAFPPISRLWFGLSEDPEHHEDKITGLYRPGPFADRARQLQEFVESQHTAEKPPFSFMHVELPHLPWRFLPSGRTYNFDQEKSFQPAGALGELAEDWGTETAIVARNEHRYLQQVRFIDRFMGDLLDRLQQTGLLDQCLLIVTADHGVSFRPGHSRRVPDEVNLPEILSVPLFVKLPGQTAGRVSDSNIQSVDILPTIADLLGITLTEPVDGVPISRDTVRPRKTLYFDDGMTVLEPAIPRLKAAVERRTAIFGDDLTDVPPRSACTHFDWHGRPSNGFTIDDQPLASLRIEPAVRDVSETGSEFLPCLVAGTLDPREIAESPVDLVVAVNGVIRDSGPTFRKGRGRGGFEFLLPESTVQQRPCQLELFHVVNAAADRPRLRRLGKWNVGERL